MSLGWTQLGASPAVPTSMRNPHPRQVGTYPSWVTVSLADSCWGWEGQTSSWKREPSWGCSARAISHPHRAAGSAGPWRGSSGAKLRWTRSPESRKAMGGAGNSGIPSGARRNRLGVGRWGPRWAPPCRASPCPAPFSRAGALRSVLLPSSPRCGASAAPCAWHGAAAGAAAGLGLTLRSG